jgi:hypothetical protein
VFDEFHHFAGQEPATLPAHYFVGMYALVVRSGVLLFL